LFNRHRRLQAPSGFAAGTVPGAAMLASEAPYAPEPRYEAILIDRIPGRQPWRFSRLPRDSRWREDGRRNGSRAREAAGIGLGDAQGHKIVAVPMVRDGSCRPAV